LPGAAAVAFGHVRLRCALPSAPVDIARSFNERYHNNQNPILLEFRLADAGGGIERGAAVSLSVTWDSASSESYVAYSVRSRLLEDRVEALQVSWFASAGRFCRERSPAAPGRTSAGVTWRAPESAASVHLWAVLRDERGGVDFLELTLDVQ
jgi:hypothetical protein